MRDWRSSLPMAIGKTGADDARSLEEAVAIATIELDLISEGQEAASHYTKKEIAIIKKWLNAHR